jgi:hypothetical protein
MPETCHGEHNYHSRISIKMPKQVYMMHSLSKTMLSTAEVDHPISQSFNPSSHGVPALGKHL